MAKAPGSLRGRQPRHRRPRRRVRPAGGQGQRRRFLRSARGGAARRSSAPAAAAGPSAIEVDTCRFYGHHSGDAQLYRGKDEVKRLREERDCLKHFRRRVTEAALLDSDELDAVDDEVAALIDQAVATARAGGAARADARC